MLGKKLDMFIDKVHVSGTVQVKHSVERFDLEERIAALKQGRASPAPVATAVEEAELVSVELGHMLASTQPGDDI